MRGSSLKNHPDQFFKTDHLKHDLKGRSVRGGIVTIAAQGTRFVLRTASTVVLARLLSPEDYGLIGMVTVFISFADLFKDLGLSAATLQKLDINHKQVSTLFWINFAVSCLIALIVAALAPGIAWFYGEPRLVWVTIVLSTGFILSGLTVQHETLLKRQMRFTNLAWIQITATFVGLTSGVVAANYGLGYWSLVVMQLVTTITNTIGVWIGCAWRPGLPARNAGIYSMLTFGSNITGFNCVNYFSRNLDNVLIGRYWGSAELGLYAKAYQLILLPIEQINNPITSVALPALSRLQSDIASYCRYYYKAVFCMASLSMPMIGLMFVTADSLILLLLGEQWTGVVPLFQLLMPAAFNSTLGAALGWAYQSLGTVNRQLRWGIVSSAANVILFMIGVRWGAIGVAAAYGLSRPIFLVVAFAYCFHGTPLRLSNLAKTLAHPAIAFASATIVVLIVNQMLLVKTNPLINVFVDCLLYGLLYLGTWAILPNGKTTLAEMFEITKSFRKKKQNKN